MKQRFTKVSVFAMCLLCGAGTIGTQKTQAARIEGVESDLTQNLEANGVDSEGFRLVLKADGSLYSLNQAVNLRLKFSSVSREGIIVGYEPGLTFKLVVQRPDGTVAPLTTRGKQRDWIAHTFGSGRGGATAPGSLWEEGFHAVNYDFDMTQIGEYSLQVSREVPSIADPEKQVRIYSNVVNVTILSAGQQKQLEIRERQASAARLRNWLGEKKQLLPPKDFALSVEADRRSYAPGDRLAFEATLQNRGADISFTDAPQYKIEVMQADGALVPLTPQGQDAQGMVEPIESLGLRVLRSGQSEKVHLDTSHNYDLQKPGDYWLRVSREVPRRDADDDDEETKMLYSNVLKFTIEAPKVEEPKPTK